MRRKSAKVGQRQADLTRPFLWTIGQYGDLYDTRKIISKAVPSRAEGFNTKARVNERCMIMCMSPLNLSKEKACNQLDYSSLKRLWNPEGLSLSLLSSRCLGL